MKFNQVARASLSAQTAAKRRPAIRFNALMQSKCSSIHHTATIKLIYKKERQLNQTSAPADRSQRKFAIKTLHSKKSTREANEPNNDDSSSSKNKRARADNNNNNKNI